MSEVQERFRAPVISINSIEYHLKTSLMSPHKLVPIFLGDSGMGKTMEVTRVIEDVLGQKLCLVPMANFTESAEWGTMVPNEDLTKLIPMVAEFLTEIENSGEPGVLLLDDIGRADDRVLKHIFSLVDSRMRKFMQFDLPEKWGVVLTMNPGGALYDASPRFRDPAIRRRLRFFWVENKPQDFLAYAERKSFYPPLLRFLRANPSLIHETRGRDHFEGPYGCPASYEDVNTVLCALADTERNALFEEDRIELENTIASIIGRPIATQLAKQLEESLFSTDPRDLLFRYTAQSKIRQRVLEYTERGGSNVLSESIRAIGITLRGQPGPIGRVAECLAFFLLDLAENGMCDLVQMFWRDAAPTGDSWKDGYVDYLEALSAAMHKDPRFLEMRDFLAKAQKNLRQDSQ